MSVSMVKLEISVVKLIGQPYGWFHGNSFKGFSIVFPAPWLAKVESSQKSNGMWFFRQFFAPYLFDRRRNNSRDKLRSKFWPEKMFRKPHLKLLRRCLVRGTNKYFSQIGPKIWRSNFDLNRQQKLLDDIVMTSKWQYHGDQFGGNWQNQK